jgi:hypothetical protein
MGNWFVEFIDRDVLPGTVCISVAKRQTFVVGRGTVQKNQQTGEKFIDVDGERVLLSEHEAELIRKYTAVMPEQEG